MKLSADDVLRLEKAAYGLAEAPRAWFLRLSRELADAGLEISELAPCCFYLRDTETRELQGICGVHIDDLLGGGTPEIDRRLALLRKKLPFGDFWHQTITYTGAEIRQAPDFSIELSQESYIDKRRGKASDPLDDPALIRACSGQLARVANHSRPDQTFLASFLQGVQDQALVSPI